MIARNHFLKHETSSSTPIYEALTINSADDCNWDDSCDLLVLGGGVAGASAALKGAEIGGMDIILADRFSGGGTTALSGGVVYAGGGTSAQQECGVEDTVDDLLGYLKYEVGDLIPEVELRRFAESSPHMIDWLEKNGAIFGGPLAKQKTSYPGPEKFLYYSGNEGTVEGAKHAKPAPRGHRAKPRIKRGRYGGSGYNLMAALLATISSIPSIRFFRRSSIRRLVVTTNGEVVGAELWQIPPGLWSLVHATLNFMSKNVKLSLLGFAQPLWDAIARLERKRAQPRLVRAHGGVVLALGGFIQNPQMVRDTAPIYSNCGRAGSIADDGSAVRLGASVNARFSQMDQVSCWRFINPPASWTKGIVIDPGGNRLTNEEQYGARMGGAMFDKAEGRGWLIVDDDIQTQAKQDLESGELWPFQKLPGIVAMKLAKSNESVAGLERDIGVPAGALATTIKTYNCDSVEGRPDSLGKSASLVKPLVKAPFYAMDISYDQRHLPMAGITLGGLDVDPETGAVFRNDGSVISGLFAAGRSAVGICSRNYISGLSLADGVWSGWRAALAIASKKRDSSI